MQHLPGIGQNISEMQFKKAEEIATEIRGTIALRDKLAHEHNLDVEFAYPSELWNNSLNLYAYVLKPSYEIVNTWRMHMVLFTGFAALQTVGTPMPLKRRFKYRYLTDGLPEYAIARPPEMLAELGWITKNGLVNMDTFINQGHLSSLYRNGILDYLKGLGRPLKILDIGGGYGGLAYALKNIFPNSRYYLVDLPGSLIFPSIYLGLAHEQYVPIPCVYDGANKKMLHPEGDQFTFIPNFLLPDLAGATKFDFVINTGSFGEMNPYQVEHYAAFIKEHLAEDGLLYEDSIDGGDFDSSAPKIVAKYFPHKLGFEGSRRMWFSDSAVGSAVSKHAKRRPTWLYLADLPIYLLSKARWVAWSLSKRLQRSTRAAHEVAQ